MFFPSFHNHFVHLQLQFDRHQQQSPASPETKGQVLITIAAANQLQSTAEEHLGAMAEPNQNQPDPLDNPNEDENAPARGNNNNAHQPGDEEILEMLNALPAEDNPEDEEAILLNALPAEDNPEDEDAILLNALNEDTILDQIEDEPVGIFEESERQRTQTARINRVRFSIPLRELNKSNSSFSNSDVV